MLLRTLLSLIVFAPLLARAGYEFRIIRRDLPSVARLTVQQEVAKELEGQGAAAPEYLATRRKQLTREITERRAQGGHVEHLSVCIGDWGSEMRSTYGASPTSIQREDGNVSISFTEARNVSMSSRVVREAAKTYLMTGYLDPNAKEVAENVYEYTPPVGPDAYVTERFSLKWTDASKTTLDSLTLQRRYRRHSEWDQVVRWKVLRSGPKGGPLISMADAVSPEGDEESTTRYELVGSVPDPKIPFDPLADIPIGAVVTDDTLGSEKVVRHTWTGTRVPPEVALAEQERKRQKESDAAADRNDPRRYFALAAIILIALAVLLKERRKKV